MASAPANAVPPSHSDASSKNSSVTSQCKFCKLDTSPDVEICPHCHQWQEKKKRGFEQWLSLTGAVIGLSSTVILLGVSAVDRLWPPKSHLVLTHESTCLTDKNGIIVEVENKGRGVGFAPWIGKHRAPFEEYAISLSLADMTRVNPNEKVQLRYVPSSDLQPKPSRISAGSCERTISIGDIGTAYCKCELVR